MSGTMVTVLVVILGPPLSSAFWFLWLPPRRHRNWFYPCWILTGIVNAVIAAVAGQWPELAGSLATSAVAAVLWWLSRRRRDRAPRAYGAKSRALVAALVRRARETAVPRPVLRPVPEGGVP